MTTYRSEREERLLQQLLDRYQPLGIVVWGEIEGAPGTYTKILVKSDGTVKVEGVTTISGAVDVSDKWARQLGQIDIARYLGSAIGVANPLHSQIVYGGVVIDPRSIRALVSSDIVTVYGSQAQALLQRTISYDLLVQLRHGGIEIDPRSIRALVKTTDEVYSVLRTDAGVAYDARDRNWTLGATDVPDLSDRASRLLGRVYGSQGQQILQRAVTYESLVQLSHQGTEYDARQTRALTSADVVDVSDKATRLLGVVYGSQAQQLLQRVTTYDLIVQLRSAGIEIDPRSIRALVKTTDEIYSVLRTDAGVAYDARDRSWVLGASDIPDLSDKATRLLGIIYGSQGQQLLQRATTYESVVQLSHQGTEYDARQIRALTSLTDTIDVSNRAARLVGIVYGNLAQLQQRAVTADAYVQLRSAGVEIDPRDVSDRAARLVGIIYGDQGQLAQRATSGDAYVQLRSAGSEIDPRTITDITKVAGVTKYLSPTALGAGGTATIWTPASGKSARVKRIQVSVDAATRIDLRWSTTAFESYYLPANGSVVVNMVGVNEQGGVNVSLTLLSSAAATVTASAKGDDV